VPSDTGMLIRTTAATKLREVAVALGELRVRILEAVVVRDLSWSELGRLLQLSDKTARQWATEALEALAEHCAGRPVAAPLALRYRIEPGRQ
jgi:DNA-directed RNA polymerase specialized sigma24 family protein